MVAAHIDPSVRHEAVLLFDVTDGNPNGDPELGQPRTDDETGHGLVTDVAIKRMIRDTVALLHGDTPGFRIFVEAGAALSPRWTQTLDQAGRETKRGIESVSSMYWDVRMFGQVLTAGKGAHSASIRGPVQVTFARSVDPVTIHDHTITRVTQSRQEDIDKGQTTEMGVRMVVPYGLYRATVHFSAARAAQTGVTGDDLAALWKAMATMFEHSRSTRRGDMSTCGLYVFSHANALGVAPARVVTRCVDVELRSGRPVARTPDDYVRTLTTPPDGVQLTTVTDIWEGS